MCKQMYDSWKDKKTIALLIVYENKFKLVLISQVGKLWRRQKRLKLIILWKRRISENRQISAMHADWLDSWSRVGQRVHFWSSDFCP